MISMNLILVVVASLLILFVLLSIVFKIAGGAEDQAYKSRCKSSVAAYARLNSLPFGDVEADPADIACPPRFSTIDDMSQVKMKREIADMMFECWNNYGEGRLLLFSATSEKFCAICNVFDFEDRTTRVEDLPSFLMVERIPVRNKDGVRPTYYDYIMGVNTGTVFSDSNTPPDSSYLDGGKRYVVAFTYFKESWVNKLLNGLAAAGVAALTVGGAVAITVFTGGMGAPLALMMVGASAATAGGVAAAGTTSADWDANIVLTEYDPQLISEIGCDQLPVSMVDERFR